MPIYCYECSACGHQDEEFHHMNEDGPECPNCGPIGTYQRVPTLIHTFKDYHKPIEMHSIGVAHADEIEDFQRRNPGVDISSDVNDPLYGVPIARSFSEKKRILKTEGYVDKRGYG